MRYAGNLNDILNKKSKMSQRSVRQPQPQCAPRAIFASVGTLQTFPDNSSVTVHRQVEGQLTCGMRCLQNMYGQYIVSREEMDAHAQQLEKTSHGVEMYNQGLGFYAIEVLESVLQKQGKYVQRIALDKITPEYYIPMIEQNPTFTGYIVALGEGMMKHYIVVRFNGQYKRIDSLPGVTTRKIASDNLFQRFSDGNIYCSLDETQPVVAVMAVGGSPFVEYNVLHDSWSASIPDITELNPVIMQALDYQKQLKVLTPGPEKEWYRSWQYKRTMPTSKCLETIVSRVRQQFEAEKSIIVYYKKDQTIIRCKTMATLITDLKAMQWVSTGTPFILKQEGRQVYPVGQGTMDWQLPLHLSNDNHPQIGGFYTFKCTVEGTCIGQQHNAYSVRDTQGKVHVIYKHSIETITQ